MIKSFKCPDTQYLFETGSTHRWSSCQSVAERKLATLDAATTLAFLRSPPSNRLEAMKGNLTTTQWKNRHVHQRHAPRSPR